MLSALLRLYTYSKIYQQVKLKCKFWNLNGSSVLPFPQHHGTTLDHHIFPTHPKLSVSNVHDFKIDRRKIKTISLCNNGPHLMSIRFKTKIITWIKSIKGLFFNFFLIISKKSNETVCYKLVLMPVIFLCFNYNVNFHQFHCKNQVWIEHLKRID